MGGIPIKLGPLREFESGFFLSRHLVKLRAKGEDVVEVHECVSCSAGCQVDRRSFEEGPVVLRVLVCNPRKAGSESNLILPVVSLGYGEQGTVVIPRRTASRMQVVESACEVACGEHLVRLIEVLLQGEIGCTRHTPVSHETPATHPSTAG